MVKLWCNSCLFREQWYPSISDVILVNHDAMAFCSENNGIKAVMSCCKYTKERWYPSNSHMTVSHTNWKLQSSNLNAAQTAEKKYEHLLPIYHCNTSNSCRIKNSSRWRIKDDGLENKDFKSQREDEKGCGIRVENVPLWGKGNVSAVLQMPEREAKNAQVSKTEHHSYHLTYWADSQVEMSHLVGQHLLLYLILWQTCVDGYAFVVLKNQFSAARWRKDFSTEISWCHHLPMRAWCWKNLGSHNRHSIGKLMSAWWEENWTLTWEITDENNLLNWS